MWWVDDDLKGITAVALAAVNIEHPGGEIVISSFTAWEIAMLVAVGRRALSVEVKPNLEKIGKIPGVTFIAFDNEIGIEAVNLPGEFHNDPAARLIAATTRKFGAPIVTTEENIRGYRHVRAMW